ncbi:hypothetical protein N9Y42_01785 [Mariniblastus sp.]|nr:hypothetical protein [Mariniblastus sp.]
MILNGGEFEAMGKKIVKFEDGWGYLNIGSSTAKLHQSSSPTWLPQEFALDQNQRNSQLSALLNSGEVFNSGELSIYLPPELSLKIDRRDDVKWKEVFDYLTELAAEGETFSTKIPTADEVKSDRVPVPQTSLRRFYETLLILSTKDLRKSTADYLTKERGQKKRIGKMSKMIDQSIGHVARYINTGEDFHPDRGPVYKIDKYLDNRSKYAYCLQAKLRNGSEIYSESSKIGFIDYEINPLRTTDYAVNDDGRIGTSGYGGLDLLLVDQTEKTPVLVVGEIKAATDTDIFLAFVQSLVYAVELGSENQFERLRTQPENCGKLEGLDLATGLDVYLIFQKHPSEVGLYPQTRRFCEMLFQHGNLIKKIIRKIKFVQATLEDDGGVSFKVHHVSESSGTEH